MSNNEQAGINRRKVIAGAAAITLSPTLAHAQSFQGIPGLMGVENHPLLKICLTLEGGKVRKLISEFLAVFAKKKIITQEQLADDADLQKAQQNITTVLNGVDFKKAFVTAVRSLHQKGYKFKFERYGRSVDTIEIRLDFHATADSGPGVIFETNGLY